MGRTLIVDDEEDMRVLLRAAIDAANRGLRVVGEAGSGQEAIALHSRLDPDIVVLDERMPGLSGLDTARSLLDEKPNLPIILYSAFLDANVARQATQVGVRTCIKKGDTQGLVLALRELTAAS